MKGITIADSFSHVFHHWQGEMERHLLVAFSLSKPAYIHERNHDTTENHDQDVIRLPESRKYLYLPNISCTSQISL